MQRDNQLRNTRFKVNNPARDIATQLCNKYNWLQDGKYRLEEGCLPNLDSVFVFVENPSSKLQTDIRRDTFVEFDCSVVNINDYGLSEEAISDV